MKESILLFNSVMVFVLSIGDNNERNNILKKLVILLKKDINSQLDMM